MLWQFITATVNAPEWFDNVAVGVELSVQKEPVKGSSALFSSFFILNFFPSLFNSFNSACSFLLAACSFGVRSGVINTFWITLRRSVLRSLMQFLITDEFSKSEAREIFRSLGLSLFYPNRWL